MATSFPTGKKILLGRELADLIGPLGGRAGAAMLTETGPARLDTPEPPGRAEGHGLAAEAPVWAKPARQEVPVWDDPPTGRARRRVRTRRACRGTGGRR